MRVVLLALALTLTCSASAAEEPLDLLFSTPHLKAMEPGGGATYTHVRRSSGMPALGPDYEGVISLDLGEPGRNGLPGVSVVLDAEGTPRRLDEFHGLSGNPILMVFLENTVRALSTATGSSPFYLRRRIKEALRERLAARSLTVDTGFGSLAAREFKLRPFDRDTNRARLGVFAEMEIRFLLSEQAPGMFLSLTALTPDGAEPAYFEEIRLGQTR